MRVGEEWVEENAGGCHCDSVSKVFVDRVALVVVDSADNGRVPLTRSGERGCNGCQSLDGNLNAGGGGGSIAAIMGGEFSSCYCMSVVSLVRCTASCSRSRDVLLMFALELIWQSRVAMLQQVNY